MPVVPVHGSNPGALCSVSLRQLRPSPKTAMERVQNPPEDLGNALPPVTAQSAAPQRRNVAVLALAQALFMSVQGMGIAATPLAAYMLLGADEKWLATVPIFLVHLGHHGHHHPRLPADGRIGRRAGFSLGALLGVGCGARRLRRALPAELPAAVRLGRAAGHAGGVLLVLPAGRGRCLRARLPRQGDLAGDGGRRARRLPRAADRQVGGRLAGAGDVRRRLRGHGRLLDRRAGAGPAPAHPGAQRGRARRRRPAHGARSRASRPIAWRWPPRCSATPS